MINSSAKKAIQIGRKEGPKKLLSRIISKFLKKGSLVTWVSGFPYRVSESCDNPYNTEFQRRIHDSLNQLGRDFVPLAAEQIDTSRSTIRVIAFYLPQFHPIPENDKHWGMGFTEWTNVSKAVPQFVGHYQPRLPGELGFYDLRLKEIQIRQIALARQYGIHGFCYHHYWFGGKKVLEKPLQQILSDPSLDLPFCLCWANENWTRRWDGRDHEIILAQSHSAEDDLAFFDDILPALRDRRYIQIDGKPLLIVYRPNLLPDPAATARRWRQASLEAGLPGLFIASAATFDFEDYESIDYDGLVQFPPHNVAAFDITRHQIMLNKHFSGSVYDYADYSENAIKALEGKKHTFPCVMINWDNEARKPWKSHVFIGASPLAYKKWLRRCFDFVLSRNPREERLVFINAWNEWAEGTYLEPDRRYGYAYLHATADLIREYYKSDGTDAIIHSNNAHFSKKYETALILHLYYFDLLDELASLLADHKELDIFITIPRHMSREQIEIILSLDYNIFLIPTQNRGRDILPFITSLTVVRDYGYKYFVKIHSKKSPHRADGDKLRQRAYEELLNPRTMRQVIRSLRKDATLGLVGPANSLLSLSNIKYLINNEYHLRNCLNRLNITDTPLDFEFIAGSMFWARVDALAILDDLALCEDDFEDELGQLDGTLAHALERLFSFLCQSSGYRTLTTDQLS